jgi:endonuclease/exonuclease/phosphatase family metal-dependent hydrolase
MASITNTGANTATSAVRSADSAGTTDPDKSLEHLPSQPTSSPAQPALAAETPLTAEPALAAQLVQPPLREQLLTHQLRPHFAQLAAHESTAELQASKLYQQLENEITQVVRGQEFRCLASPASPSKPFYRAVAWNLERGICFEPILEELQTHPLLKTADLLLLTETDIGMARSKNRNVARELAAALGMHYYFLPAYLNLCKGSGIESDFEGENDLALHGNAILSRYPMRDFQAIPLQNAKDKMRGKEKRIGSQQVLAATIDFPQGALRAVCIHLDALSTQRQRQRQMASILARLTVPSGMPVLLGGDWNTSTYNSRRAIYAILGFWYRVFMGVGNVIANHYPYPDRYFERGLFQLLRQAGYDYEHCNELGAGTNHYSVDDFKKYKNLSDWVPQWCFAFIQWALRSNGGKCSLKLDWFASKDLRVVAPADLPLQYQPLPDQSLSPQPLPALAPKVVQGLKRDGQEISDHDPILVDFMI